MPMKILIENKEKLNIINKSRFIGIVKKVYNKEEALELLEKLHQKYPDATHICYAYNLPNNQKYSDDAEPEGTAGIPILEILKKNDLTYVIAIVIRYFGGIKLGSNGLIRAYSGIIGELVKDNTKDLEVGYLIKITEEYSKNDLIDYLLKNSVIISRDYQEKIIIQAIVNKKTLEKLSNVCYEIIEEKII